ncbi:helix-turn-helix domain-containing protein [Streptomyces sp. NPDC003435]
MTTPESRTTKLSPAELRVAVLLAHGLSPTGIARRLQLSSSTVEYHLTRIRRKAGLQGRQPAVVVNILLARRLVPTPPPGRPAPDMPAEDLALLDAIAHEPSLNAIAARTGIPRRKVPSHIDRLLHAAAAISTEHLVTLAHGWQFLGPPQNPTDVDTDRSAPPCCPSPGTADRSATPHVA